MIVGPPSDSEVIATGQEPRDDQVNQAAGELCLGYQVMDDVAEHLGTTRQLDEASRRRSDVRKNAAAEVTRA
jgi:hypothetical protein